MHCDCFRVRPIPCRRPILDTIGRSYTDTDTDIDIGLYKFCYWKCDFVRGIGVCRLYMYVAYMCKNTVETWNYRHALQRCWLLRQVNERQDYWYRRYRYPPILASIGRYPIPVSVIRSNSSLLWKYSNLLTYNEAYHGLYCHLQYRTEIVTRLGHKIWTPKLGDCDRWPQGTRNTSLSWEIWSVFQCLGTTDRQTDRQTDGAIFW